MQPDGSQQWRLAATSNSKLRQPTAVASHLALQHGQVCRLVLPSGQTEKLPVRQSGNSTYFVKGWKRIAEAAGLQAGQVLNVKAAKGSSPLQLTLRLVTAEDEAALPAPASPRPAAAARELAPASPQPCTGFGPPAGSLATAAAGGAAETAPQELAARAPTPSGPLQLPAAQPAGPQHALQQGTARSRPRASNGILLPDGSVQWTLPVSVITQLRLPSMAAARWALQHGQVCRLLLPSGQIEELLANRDSSGTYFCGIWQRVHEAEDFRAGQLLNVKATPGSSPLELTLRVVATEGGAAQPALNSTTPAAAAQKLMPMAAAPRREPQRLVRSTAAGAATAAPQAQAAWASAHNALSRLTAAAPPARQALSGPTAGAVVLPFALSVPVSAAAEAATPSLMAAEAAAAAMPSLS